MSSPLMFQLINFGLHSVSAAALELCLVVANEGYSLVAAHRLLIAVVSPVAEHRL